MMVSVFFGGESKGGTGRVRERRSEERETEAPTAPTPSVDGAQRRRKRNLLTGQLVAKQPHLQRDRLEVAQVLAGGAHGDAERGRAVPHGRAVFLSFLRRGSDGD